MSTAQKGMKYKCPKCKGKIVREYEDGASGNITTQKCVNCGWRGDIISTERKKFQETDSTIDLNDAAKNQRPKSHALQRTMPTREVTMAEPAPRKKQTVQCFFCGQEHEKINDVGHISFTEAEHTRKIFVCHYCASESLKDILNATDPGAIQQSIGTLLYHRALDSRAW